MRRPSFVLVPLVLATAVHGWDEQQVAVWALSKALSIFAVSSVEQRYVLLAGTARVACFFSCLGAWQAAQERFATTPEDRWRVALHESGHALALIRRESVTSYDDEYLRSWSKEDAQQKKAPPRFELRGVRLWLGNGRSAPAGGTPFRFRRKEVAYEGRDLETFLELALVGRAAEVAVLGRGSAGAGGDFAVALDVARTYQALALGKRFDVGLPPKELDRKARRMVRLAHADALRFANANRPALLALARALFERERLSAKEARRIVADASSSSSSRGWLPRVLGSSSTPSSNSSSTTQKKKKSAFTFPADSRRAPSVDRWRFARFELGHFLNALFGRYLAWTLVAETLEAQAEQARVKAIASKKARGGPFRGFRPPPNKPVLIKAAA